MRKHGISFFGFESEYPGNFEIGMTEENVKDTAKNVADILGTNYGVCGEANNIYWISDGGAFRAYFTCRDGVLDEIELPCWMAKSRYIDYHENDTSAPIGCLVGFNHLTGTEVYSQMARDEFEENFYDLVGEIAVLLDETSKVIEILQESGPGLSLEIIKYDDTPGHYVILPSEDDDTKDLSFEIDFNKFGVDWEDEIKSYL